MFKKFYFSNYLTGYLLSSFVVVPIIVLSLLSKAMNDNFFNFLLIISFVFVFKFFITKKLQIYSK